MTIHSISSGDADVSRTHISVFTLPTRTFTGGLRFTWLDYVGEQARRKAASIHSPSASVSYLATEALMRALAAPRLGISGRSARTITVDRSCRLCTSGKPHGKPRIAGVNAPLHANTPTPARKETSGKSAANRGNLRHARGSAQEHLTPEERARLEWMREQKPPHWG